METMRSLSKEFRLQGNSLSEITAPFDKEVIDLSITLMKGDRKLKSGPFLSALALWFLSRPRTARMDIAREGLEMLRAVMEDDADVVVGGDDPRAEQFAVPDPLPPTSKKRKGAS